MFQVLVGVRLGGEHVWVKFETLAGLASVLNAGVPDPPVEKPSPPNFRQKSLEIIDSLSEEKAHELSVSDLVAIAQVYATLDVADFIEGVALVIDSRPR